MSTIPQPGTEVERKPWQTGLAPVYIGTVLWIAFFDQIGRRALPLGGLLPATLGATVAGPLAYLLMFRPSGLWGFRSREPARVIAASTFGVQGARLVPGLLLGIAQVVLFAVAVGYAVELTFQSLALVGLVGPGPLRPSKTNGADLKSPLYLTIALAWAVITALVSLRFTRWIAYLMQFFPIFPALAIGGAMLAMLPGLRSFAPTGIDPAVPGLAPSALEASLLAFLMTFQWVFAFSAMGGLLAADWGAASPEATDVTVGGWVGVGMAPAILAALALIAVAGFEGSRRPEPTFEAARPMNRSSIEEIQPVAKTGAMPGLDAPAFTFRAVANGGFGRSVGSLILITFGLASLAPAVYSSFGFGNQFKELGPGISRTIWTLLGTFTAWLLIVGGWAEKTELVFSLLGAAFAPAAGAIAADYRRQRGLWSGPRPGLNLAGLLAWVIGLAVGLAPIVGRAVGSNRLDRLQPAAVAAFVASYLAYEVLAFCRLEPTVERPES